MEIEKPIQIIYAPGTFGNTLRWMFDRFTKGSKLKAFDSPWDKDGRAHGFFDKSIFNNKYMRGHQLNDRSDSPNPNAEQVVLSFDSIDLPFIVRCGFYRNPGNENDESRYKGIIALADQSFVTKTFGNAPMKAVAKELLKIQFHDMSNQKWWTAIKELISNSNYYQFNMYALWNEHMLTKELTSVSERYKLDFEIDQKVIRNVVQNIKNTHVVITKNRVKQVLDAIMAQENMSCEGLDIVEQAFVESELEKIHDGVLFPYGYNWFKNTEQINEFLNTYPTYLKHMNPRLPWYNNIANPFYLTGQIDKSK